MRLPPPLSLEGNATCLVPDRGNELVFLGTPDPVAEEATTMATKQPDSPYSGQSIKSTPTRTELNPTPGPDTTPPPPPSPKLKSPPAMPGYRDASGTLTGDEIAAALAEEDQLTAEQRKILRTMGVEPGRFLIDRAADRKARGELPPTQPASAAVIPQSQALSNGEGMSSEAFAKAMELCMRIREEAALTPSEREIIKNCGLTPQRFLEHRAELRRRGQ